MDIPPEAEAMSDKLKHQMGASSVWLFGSYARGTANADSDIDLLAVVPKSNATRYHRALEARRLVRDIRVPKDIIVLTQEEWERELQVPSSLSSTVQREGVALSRG